jgi:imidazole glycerol phosphate synthase subunit HisF
MMPKRVLPTLMKHNVKMGYGFIFLVSLNIKGTYVGFQSRLLKKIRFVNNVLL